MGVPLTRPKSVDNSSASRTKFAGKRLEWLPEVDATLLDCQLHPVCKGRLALKTCELAFSSGSSKLTWPLWSLRWYGRDCDHFVFETGLRCPSGSGLFFFKCKNSKRLARSLDERIRLISRLGGNVCRTTSTSKCIRHSIPKCSNPSTLLVKMVFHHTHDTQCQIENSTQLFAHNPSDETSNLTENINSNPSTVDNTGLTDSALCYSLLRSVSSVPSVCAESPGHQDGYGTIRSANCESQETLPNGQYLIAAAAPHSYVNQPNCRFPVVSHDVQRSANISDRNDYVPEPT